jgi:hypothetical protein
VPAVTREFPCWPRALFTPFERAAGTAAARANRVIFRAVIAAMSRAIET